MNVVFLLDVDNTLIDNDRVRERLAAATERILGPSLSAAYWGVYEEVRTELGYVDSLETLERFHARHPGVPSGPLDRAILDFPYPEARYPEALEVLRALGHVGTAVVLSDGDPVFQPLKIHRAGVADAVSGNVLVFTHKDEHLDDVARLFPAERYVAVDDKAKVLARIKRHWSARVSTVHVLQGKYADDPYEGPPPDAVISRIGDLIGLMGTPEALRVFLQDARIRPGG
ncbi:MAG: haloacid dehalogenase-like hydrolase [Candidatus Limnocylindria bacterium]|nr:haloacid dehalogenase-like hydrolase [Candidatus Limnocylindria bacterium]